MRWSSEIEERRCADREEATVPRGLFQISISVAFLYPPAAVLFHSGVIFRRYGCRKYGRGYSVAAHNHQGRDNNDNEIENG